MRGRMTPRRKKKAEVFHVSQKERKDGRCAFAAGPQHGRKEKEGLLLVVTSRGKE